MNGRLLLGGALLASTLTVATSGAPHVAQAAAPGAIVFNEIHYHPEDDHPNGEFLELRNTTGGSIDLAGWCVDGIGYCFPAGFAVPAGGLIVTTSASWGGALSNGGEDLTLLDPADRVIDELEYDDKDEWPANTDGNGASLQRRSLAAASSDPGNWFGGAPTPGAANTGQGAPFIILDDVEHTVSPAAGEALALEAEADGVTSATVEYRVGFGPVRTVAGVIAGDVLRATIPGQPAGELVRYRWVVSGGGATGTYPRQGDGMTYTGTVVASPAGSSLPRLQWFMDDATYQAARNDLTKRGDDGYPAVFAFDGEVFDNTIVRVKGQTSRYWTKKKWKFVLPNGHDLDFGGLTSEDVDEFALHSSWSDKSFLREILSAEFMEEVGLPVSEAFPVRLERNGRFFGLYTYVEQRDGTFRDRHDYGDATVYEVGGNDQFGDMRAVHGSLPDDRLRRFYGKDTNEWQNDDELRDLIRVMNAPLSRRAEIIAERVDASTIINTIAANMVIQHQDWGLKNYDLRLTDQELWAITPTDFDLTWGRRGLLTCGSLCDLVGVGGAFEHPGTPLFEAFWFNPYYADKIRQRVRTIVDEHFDPARWNARVVELRDRVAADAATDRTVWGTYGSGQSPAAAAADIIDRFVNPQHARLLGTMVAQGRVSAIRQPATPRVTISDVEYDGTDAWPAWVTLTNQEGVPVDLSGFEIEELGLEVTAGTILNPGETAIAFHEDAETLRGRFPGMVFAGLFEDEPVDADGGFHLTDRQGDRLSSITLLPPGEMTKFSGRADTSAVLNIVAVDTNRGGYLQVIDCDGDPGATSNLNVDGRLQTRAGAAVARFDAAGELCVYNHAATHVVVDLVGYLASGAIDDLADVRLVDTRQSAGPLAAGQRLRLAGRPDSSALLNLVAVDTTGGGYLQLLPCGASPGLVSNANYDSPGQTRSGLAVARFDAAGELCVFTSATTHVVVDLQAYLTDGALDDVADVRLLDTRIGGPKPGDGSMVRFEGRPGSSAFVSVVVTESTGGGYGQLLGCGEVPGATSNINVDRAGQTIANLSIVEFGPDGSACLYLHRGAHVVVDLQAYLDGGAFDDVTDERLLDSRP